MLSPTDRALLQQLKDRLRAIEDRVSRLSFFVRELRHDSGADDRPMPFESGSMEYGTRRRSDLLRRATLLLLEGAHQGAQV